MKKRLVEKFGIVTVSQQLSWKKDYYYLPVREGRCVYYIEVLEGRMRLNHESYNQDGAIWDLPARGDQEDHYDFKEGATATLVINIEKNANQLDQLRVVNPSMLDELTFKYRVDY